MEPDDAATAKFCSECALLVLFEDLHWIDGETQAFLDTLVESVPAVLLLVNYRPEYRHPWSGKSHYRSCGRKP